MAFTRDCENSYELQYSNARRELFLLITNLCNAALNQIIVIPNECCKEPVFVPYPIETDDCRRDCSRNSQRDCQRDSQRDCFESECSETSTSVQCIKGRKGSKGDPGCCGEKGDRGCPGFNGCPGEKGEKGDRGCQGLQGPQGLSGCCGEKGERGKRGHSIQGEKGCPGCDGQNGCCGTDGLDGEKGDKGDRGDKGNRGADGEKGDCGEKGCNGIGFKYLCWYEPCKIYHLNDVVRSEDCQCNGAIYVYTLKTPSEPQPKYSKIESAPGWKLMLKDGCCNKKCDTLTSTSACEPIETTTCDSRYCDNYQLEDSPFDRVLNHNQPNQPQPSKLGTSSNYISGLIYRGDWIKTQKYKKNDMIKYKNTFYISIRDNNNSAPNSKSDTWFMFMNDSPMYRGIWDKESSYFVNNIVQHSSSTFLAIDTVPLGYSVYDNRYWIQLGNINNSNKQIIESYNQDMLEERQNPARKSKSINFEPIKDLDLTLNQQSFYYASRQSDIKYDPITKQSKWYVPIIFDKVLELTNSFDNRRGQTIFNKSGLYKVTIHVNFTGTNLFKTSAYLLRPLDDPESNSYQKDRKITASKMTMTCASKIKNHLHYNFIVKVRDALSTLVVMSEHKTMELRNLVEERAITIFGKEKTWILIEKMD